MSFRLGLTGSIGMGKSTTAAMFAARGYPVWDADAAVHRLYAPGGAAVNRISQLHPAAIIAGAVSREVLREALAVDDTLLGQLESIVFPLVSADRAAFIDTARKSGARIVVLDIPLLFETGVAAEMDGVAVVSTDAATQRARVLARPGMTEVRFDLMLSRQMPDAEKRARADWIIPTDTLATAEATVAAICAELEGKPDA
ncbi:MAG: dephospho-CoA kinase [Paracoccus sp. (in: a-proteobacteria)]